MVRGVFDSKIMGLAIIIGLFSITSVKFGPIWLAIGPTDKQKSAPKNFGLYKYGGPRLGGYSPPFPCAYTQYHLASRDL